MLCCCCWPPRLCAISLSMVDTVLVALLFYRAADLLCATFGHIDFVDVIIFAVLLGLLICEILAIVTLILSDKRGIARYVWPRFTLLICQFTTASVICFFLLLYFSGYSEAMNNAFISGYEYWAGIELSKEERKDAYSDLYMYAVGLFILLLVYAIYNGFEIYVTYKYYETLPPENFTTVKQSDGRPPRPPPPPFNPNFKSGPLGDYK